MNRTCTGNGGPNPFHLRSFQRLVCRCGKEDFKRRALAWLAVYPYSALMAANDTEDCRESVQTAKGGPGERTSRAGIA